MSEVVQPIRESLVTPEDIVLGDTFIANLKIIYSQVKKMRKLGATMYPKVSLNADTRQEDRTDILLIPSEPIEFSTYYPWGGIFKQGHMDDNAGEADQPLFLNRLHTNISDEESKKLILTGQVNGHDANGVYIQYYDFDPDKHTLAIIK
jgi:hypothetical protein